MTSTPVRYLTEEQQPALLFSVCTLVASAEKYECLLRSFAKFGFDESNCEFIALDNRKANRFDGYQALRAVYPQCNGEFILLTHDDIELVEDGATDLERILRNLNAQSPNWTVAGNSGFTVGPKERHFIHLRDPHGERRDVTKPVAVGGLDENFLVLPRARMVFPSLDLSGFHLFATDLCEQSRFVGGRAFVIPFFLEHKSAGKPSPALVESMAAFKRKYTGLTRRRVFRAPATTIYIGLAGQLQKLRDVSIRIIENKLAAIGRRVAAIFGNSAGNVGG